VGDIAVTAPVEAKPVAATASVGAGDPVAATVTVTAAAAASAAAAAPAAPAQPAWAPEAERELGKIPFFVRGKARRNTERFAADRGVALITRDTLYEAKAHYGR
jgi:light-independent protochlorophyllide reductase subunit B